MTETQKKFAIIGGVFLVILIFLLIRKSNSTTIQQGNTSAPINVSIPGFTMPPRSSFNIPGLIGPSQYDFNAISPCMCNGATSTTPKTGSGLTFVINQGSSGPTVYDYSSSSSSCNQTCLQYGPSQIVNGRYYTPCVKWSDCNNPFSIWAAR